MQLNKIFSEKGSTGFVRFSVGSVVQKRLRTPDLLEAVLICRSV